jgi:dienelactone hydrolase
MRIYVCHPFAGDPEGNADRVRAICRVLVESGLLPVAPQVYLPQFMDETTDRDRALELCLGLLEVCHELRVYGGRITSGMRLEIDRAEALGIPVRFVDVEAA